MRLNHLKINFMVRLNLILKYKCQCPDGSCEYIFKLLIDQSYILDLCDIDKYVCYCCAKEKCE